MKITSPAFGDKQPVPVQHTCKGANISPPLEFADVPAQSESLALVVEDLDSGNQWIHWLVYNIPGHVRRMEAGKLPENAVDGICNGGTTGYEGPCPKYFDGTHHYSFKLFALDKVLEIAPNADNKQVQQHMQGHILATAELVGIAEGELSVVNSSEH